MERNCINCGTDKTYINKGYPDWYRYQDGFICRKCYKKLIEGPRWRQNNPEYMKIYGNRRMKFTPLGKQILLTENPRKGICQMCGAVKGKDCKITHIHHIQYHLDNPLKDTVELCITCHGKITYTEYGNQFNKP